MRGNSLYDPDESGTGGKPYGMNQLSALYDNYTVYGSKIELQCVITNASSTVSSQTAQVVLVPLSNSNLPQSSMTLLHQIATLPYAQYKIANLVGGQGKLVFKQYMSTAKINGEPKKKISTEEDYSAEVGASPLKQWLWYVGAQQVADTGSFTIHIVHKITYYCRFYGRKTFAQS